MAIITKNNHPKFVAGFTEMSLPYNTFTKMTYNTELEDSDGAYDHSTNYRFTVPAGKGGFYHLTAWYTVATGTDSTAFELWLYKNGSASTGGEDMQGKSVNQSYNTVACATVIELAAGDYVEMYAKQASGGATSSYNIGYSNEGRFTGYKLIT